MGVGALWGERSPRTLCLWRGILPKQRGIVHKTVCNFPRYPMTRGKRSTRQKGVMSTVLFVFQLMPSQWSFPTLDSRSDHSMALQFRYTFHISRVVHIYFSPKKCTKNPLQERHCASHAGKVGGILFTVGGISTEKTHLPGADAS